MPRAIISALPASKTGGVRGVPDGDATAAPVDDYADKLLKLIPGEVIGVYLSMVMILNGSKAGAEGALPWLVFAFGVFATYFYLRVTLKVTDIRQLLVTVGAFCVWAYSMGKPPFVEESCLYDDTYAGLLLVAYTFIAPKIPMGKRTAAN